MLVSPDALTPTAGTLSYLTPRKLGQALDDYVAGNWSSAALLWQAFLRADDTIPVVAEKRLKKVIKEVKDYTITTVDDSPQAQAQADYLTQLYTNLTVSNYANPYEYGSLTKLSEFVLQAISYQTSCLAKQWSATNGMINLHLEYVDLANFCQKNRKIYMLANGSPSLQLNPDEWLIATRSRAIMHAVSILGLFKRLPMHTLVGILEKWGTPNVIGSTGATPNSPEWQDFFAAVSAYRNGYSAVISNDSTIKHVGGEVKQSVMHERFIALCNKLITTQYLGGELSTSASSGTGTLAGGAQSDDTDDIISADCDWLTEIYRTQIDRPALALQYPNQPPLASITIRMADATDDKAQMALLTSAIKLGARVPESYIHDRFALPEATPTDAVLKVKFALAAAAEAKLSAEAEAETPTPTTAKNSTPPPRKPDPRQANLNQLITNSLPLVRQAERAMYAPLITQLKLTQGSAAAKELVDTYIVPTPLANDYATLVAQMIYTATLIGYQPIHPYPWLQSPTPTNAQDPDPYTQYYPLPFDEAILFWTQKTLITDYSDISADTIAQAQVLGFKVANITQKTVLADIASKVAKVITGDLTYTEAIAAIAPTIGTVHADIVVHTNVASAFAWGNYQQLTHPEVLQTYPIWGFDVVEDEATSTTCKPLANQAYPANHIIWDSLYPLNHYNCRTSVYPLTEADAKELGFVVQSSWPVDQETGAPIMPTPQFSTNIGKVPLGDILP
jgi:phage gp29-like protein